MLWFLEAVKILTGPFNTDLEPAVKSKHLTQIIYLENTFEFD